MDNPLLKKQQKSPWFTFWVCFFTAACIFIPFMIIDGGMFRYCGDFNSQQIPFYRYANEFVKTANGQYSWESDLGGSFINSFSFYLTGSPFFWLTLLLPSSWVPFFMAPMLMLKFGVCGAGAHLYLRRYAKTGHFTVFAACLYAFSGFTVYNVFFNHFVDCIALFPFLLWSLDEFVYEKRRGLFPLFVALNLMNNYFFFVGQVVFLFLYFFFKVFTHEYKITLREFLLLAAESLLGVAMGSIFLFPTVLSLTGNPRTAKISNGWSALMYYRVQQYFAIATSWLLPPDPPYMPALYTEGNIKWTSMTAFLPLVSLSGVIAYARARKKSFLNKILFACMVMSMVPILNSMFYAFNSSYYARWYYLPVLMMCLATMHALEDEDIDLRGGVRTTLILTAVIAVFGLTPQKNTEGLWQLGVEKSIPQFWASLCTALLSLLVLILVLRFSRKASQPRLARRLTVALLVVSIGYSAAHISIGKFPQWDSDYKYYPQAVQATQNIAWPEGFYRVDAYDCYDNFGLFAHKPCIRFFNSTVTPSIMEFYPQLDVKRDVSSKADYDLYALRGLLSVKYTVMPLESVANFASQYGQYGWREGFVDDTYAYYENTNYVPMAFTYSRYIRMSTLNTVSQRMRGNLLVRAVALDDEQVEKYGGLFAGTAETTALDYEHFVNDAALLRAAAAHSFTADNRGFACDITLPVQNLVFFSVPYEEGWTATVNGQAAAVEKVSGGMMAVEAPAGEAHIEFSYHTPGLKASACTVLLGVAAYAAYMAVWYLPRRKKTKKSSENGAKA